MRFLCIYRPGTKETDAPPTQEEMAAMGKLMDDMRKAGVLLAAEGCLPSSKGARVRIDSDRFSVTDGPFPEAIEWTKRFLTVVGEGESEVRLLHDMPAA